MTRKCKICETTLSMRKWEHGYCGSPECSRVLRSRESACSGADARQGIKDDQREDAVSRRYGDEAEVESCASCKFFNYLEGSVGECRRHAPLPFVIEKSGSVEKESYWAELDDFNWCGEFQPKEKE